MAPALSMFYHLFISIPFITIAQETFLTDEYGNQNGNYYSTLDQGRISQINNWGADITGIHIRDWKSDAQTNYNEIYGYHWYHEPCSPLNISSNDYIIGYRIYVDATTYYVDEDGDEEELVSMDIIRGLVFYTLNGGSYSCIEDDSVKAYSRIYTNSYLSGWNIYSQKIVNSIQFQFTQINTSIPLNIDDADDDNDKELTPSPTSTDINAIPTSSSTNDDDNSDSFSPTQNFDQLESMETNDTDSDLIFSSTVNLHSDSAEATPTETKYAQITDDSSDLPSSTPTLSDTTSDPSQDDDNGTTSSDDTDTESQIGRTQTILDDDYNPNEGTTTTTNVIIQAIEQDNDDRELAKGSGGGISQYFNSTQGTIIVIVTMGILMFTLILCCILTLCVINIKRKKRQQEANTNLSEPSPVDDVHTHNNNDVKLTIPRTLRMGEKSGGQSSTNMSVHSQDLKVSIDGIDGMDGNDTMIKESIKSKPNGNVVDISSLLSPRYGRRSTDDGSSWPINPIPRMSQGIPIRMSMPHCPPQPLDHPYSIDWTEPQMAKLTNKMANLFNEEDNRNGSFISTVKIGHNSSRQPSQMTGVTGSGHDHGSETDDAETDNDTDLMYNHMGPLNESKKTPETTKGDDASESESESDVDKEEEDEEESEEDEEQEFDNLDNDGSSPFNYVPRRNALKLLNVRSNTFGH